MPPSPHASHTPMSCPTTHAAARPSERWHAPVDAELTLAGPVEPLLRALAALRSVHDPALGADIVALGLVESLQIEDGEVRLRLVGIGADCPLCDFAADRALRALQAALPDTDIYVGHDPWLEWTPGRASRALRGALERARCG
ncbi:iron-sulfur cluster assembly protein [Leptothrix discophora]|uniref:Iron-sulfur cluster assembly protein n=1 Tax=Leptothrix discophora TaxID=89 RepID=A0ABT9G5Q9_LEPDI|nr:iron-sulfur cluster assembly protein [Leptothrix discophora]MDP4301824.1 iron-sulfur cluster assembly protein [Leptothrix discophora]